MAGFFLGIGGTTFAVGVPLVSGWYPPARKGFAIVAFLLIRDAPGRPRPAGSAWARTAGVGRLAVTWQLCFLYAVGFGGFVAFSVYLPAYLRTAYGLTAGDAALRTAGFVVLAVIARPTGGWLSDRIHPVPVLVWCFSGTALFAVVQAFQPPLIPVATIAFLGMAALLGAASGAVFASSGRSHQQTRSAPSPASSAPLRRSRRLPTPPSR